MKQTFGAKSIPESSSTPRSSLVYNVHTVFTNKRISDSMREISHHICGHQQHNYHRASPPLAHLLLLDSVDLETTVSETVSSSAHLPARQGLEDHALELLIRATCEAYVPQIPFEDTKSQFDWGEIRAVTAGRRLGECLLITRATCKHTCSEAGRSAPPRHPRSAPGCAGGGAAAHYPSPRSSSSPPARSCPGHCCSRAPPPRTG